MYLSPNVIRVEKSGRKRYIRHVAFVGERKSVYTVLVGDPEGKIPFGKPRYTQDNMKIDLKAIKWDNMDWI